jgi:branched-chain amino acid transport system ATP-binding protein
MNQRPPGFLRADAISAGYTQTPVVRDVSLEVGRGEVVLIMGPNGAGKSTLVKSITGALSLLGGTITLDGEDISRMREDERMARGVGYVPQVRSVFPPLTVMENLEMGGYRLKAAQTNARVEEIFEIFPVLRDVRRRPAKSLSGGQLKMVGIARALMAQPSLLILDEPTANLAPIVATNLLTDTVAKLASDGRAVLLIEQRVSLALAIASWGYVLTDGEIRLAASGDELRQTEDLASLFLGSGGFKNETTATRPLPEHGA